jgi:hypothetical protein
MNIICLELYILKYTYMPNRLLTYHVFNAQRRVSLRHNNQDWKAVLQKDLWGLLSWLQNKNNVIEINEILKLNEVCETMCETQGKFHLWSLWPTIHYLRVSVLLVTRIDIF